ncbi:MAG: hypothetical protein SNJ62_12940, partial [Chloracidobacterium sp.]
CSPVRRSFSGSSPAGWDEDQLPALDFALWHFVPQVIPPAENVIGFIISPFSWLCPTSTSLTVPAR